MDTGIWTSVSYQHVLYSVMLVFGIVLAGQLLRSERSPGATMAWLLFIILIPYFGVPLFLSLGGRKIRLTKKHKRVYGDKPHRIQDGHPSILERVLLSSGAPPCSRQIQFEWLDDGQRAFEALIALIDSAQSELVLTTYIFANDITGRAVADALARATQRGVRVGVLVDALLARRGTRVLMKELKQAGVHISYFMPLLHWPSQRRANLRNHRKLVVVDGTRAFVGGMNIGHDYMGPTPDPARWTDLSLRFEGPAAWDLRSIFLSDWEFASGQPFPVTAIKPAPAGTTGFAQVIASGPDVVTDSLYEALLTLAYNAEHAFTVVTPYFLPDEALMRALECAAKRGVKVQIIVPEKSNHRITDFARTSFLHGLVHAGAQIFYVQHMIHAKAILVDDRAALVGSANFDMRSLFLNFELGVFLFSSSELDWVRGWMDELRRKAVRDTTLIHKPITIWNGVGRLLSPFL